MIKYNTEPNAYIELDGIKIPQFFAKESKNIDQDVVSDFGDEWIKFDSFDTEELATIGDTYFNLLESRSITDKSEVLDIGCGTGRWAYYLADQVGFIEAIDPSKAVISASKLLAKKKNTRITQCDLENIPFDEKSFDLVYSLGVLHHMPDTKEAINIATTFVKTNGYLLLYLYYSLDNRGLLFKSIFHISNLFRQVICRLPKGLKQIVCDVIGLFVYYPLVGLAKLLKRANVSKSIWSKLPLSVYAENDCSLQILRNDALDRFGTKLENRFSRVEIKSMMENAGLDNIEFSENAPYWVAIGRKK